MQWYKADMHIHTVLSPCGGLDMSPVNIIRQAALKKLDIIAITDHNTTRHCKSAMEIGKKYGITVLAGAEINTREEIHCLTFFENTDKADMFQRFIDSSLPEIRNRPALFGYQYLVDEKENILDEESRLLIVALKAGIDEVAEQVAHLGGLFIPAHINRKSNGIYSQLGLLPDYLRFDALEVAQQHGLTDFLKEHSETGNYPIISNSDAHCLEQVGCLTTEFYLEKPDFKEIGMAFKGNCNRKVKPI